MNLNMNTPERIAMAQEAVKIQQRAALRTYESFAEEAALYGESPEALLARWGKDFKREWNARYRAARRRLVKEGLKKEYGYQVISDVPWRMNYADGIM